MLNLNELKGSKMSDAYSIYPIGYIHKKDDAVWIAVDPQYHDALLGLEEFSHINVLFWFHLNDSKDKRNILQVHPRRDKSNPLTGVFATHSPVRPNLIGLSRCRIQSIKENHIYLDAIDALDGSPVIDIKSFIPSSRQLTDLQLPVWV